MKLNFRELVPNVMQVLVYLIMIFCFKFGTNSQDFSFISSM